MPAAPRRCKGQGRGGRVKKPPIVNFPVVPRHMADGEASLFRKLIDVNAGQGQGLGGDPIFVRPFPSIGRR